jgi:hypothetical protein
METARSYVYRHEVERRTRTRRRTVPSVRAFSFTAVLTLSAGGALVELVGT